MEEKRPGRTPERDRAAPGAGQTQAARIGGAAAVTGHAADRARIREATARGKVLAEDIEAGGFGDHKGVKGFPGVPDQD